MPERIQLRRVKGWRMPPNTVKVDRSTRWGNPCRVGRDDIPDAATALRLFEKLIADGRINDSHELFIFSPQQIALDLKDKNLACWCPIGTPCHADVLLRIAQGTVDTP